MGLKNKIAFGIVGAVAGSVAVRALNNGWTQVTGHEPPDPNDPEVPVVEALAWVVASGLVLAGAQVLVNRFGVKRLQAKVKPVALRVSRGPA